MKSHFYKPNPTHVGWVGIFQSDKVGSFKKKKIQTQLMPTPKQNTLS
jgi:hypothetical protein